MADLQRKTANLVSMSEPQGDGYIADAVLKENDTTATSNSFFVTEYIPVTGGATYYYYTRLYRSSTSYIVFYDSSKNYISEVIHKRVMEDEQFNLTSIAIPSNASYLRMCIDRQSTQNCLYTSQLPAYEPYGWVHSLRKLTTATEAVENPLYSDGTAITAYTLKGNTVQSGTPSPSNPITISGVGNKTANLTSTNTWKNIYTTDSRSYFSASFQIVGGTQNIVNVRDTGDYTLKLTGLTNETVRFKHNGSTTDILIFSYACNFSEPTDLTVSFHVNGYNPTELNGIDLTNIMLNVGSTALPYEPYGFKIPISSNQTALTPVYLTEQLMKIGDYADSLASTGTATYNTKKMVLTGQETFWGADGTIGTLSRYTILPTGADAVMRGSREDIYCTHYTADANHATNTIYVYSGTTGVYIYFYVPTADYPTLADYKAYIQQQYAAGTPVTVYYILATPTTESVTAPSIPTTEGANSITVDTTVQPSEFTATWTGWHDSSVKEYDGTDWQ